MNVTLYGFMAVGKTSVGSILADRLGLEFVDLDDEIVKRAGRDIPSIFRDWGETAFRKLERDVTRDEASKDRRVIACGGGTVLDPTNLETLSSSSTLILLTAEPRVILERVQAEGDARPLLNVQDRERRIRELLGDRIQSYLQAADFIIDTTAKTPVQVAGEIEELIGGEGVWRLP